MVHVHVYSFLMSLDPVPCFILTITENLTNPVPTYVNMWEKWKIEDFMRHKTSWNISLALGPHYLVFLYNTLYGIR